MQISIKGARRSASLKIFVIGALILLMLIPMLMIHGVIDDRESAARQARYDITRSWGGEHVVGGPVLIIPYRLTRVTQYGRSLETEGRLQILPRELSIDAQLETEMRYRGVHEIPVYTATLEMSGIFDEIDSSGIGIDNATIDWERAAFALPISDARAIRSTPTIEVGDHSMRFVAGGQQVTNLPPQIIAPFGSGLNDTAPTGEIPFRISLELSGTDRLQFLPLADTTSASVRSAWPSPSFNGRYLPESRDVSDTGFDATWRVSSLGRELPSRWISSEQPEWNAAGAAFGVDLFVPIGRYQLTDRATKYAILFIGMTFVSYFLFEVIAGLRLHPLQYLLVGLANALFYLLLLSLSEHWSFGWSYLASALASSGLISGYSAAILGSRRRALLIAAILFVLYTFLYVTLQAETYAMLGGAIGLWATLAVIMYLTRRIDWYGNQPGEDAAGESGSSTRKDTPPSTFSAETEPL